MIFASSSSRALVSCELVSLDLKFFFCQFFCYEICKILHCLFSFFQHIHLFIWFVFMTSLISLFKILKKRISLDLIAVSKVFTLFSKALTRAPLLVFSSSKPSITYSLISHSFSAISKASILLNTC